MVSLLSTRCCLPVSCHVYERDIHARHVVSTQMHHAHSSQSCTPVYDVVWGMTGQRAAPVLRKLPLLLQNPKQAWLTFAARVWGLSHAPGDAGLGNGGAACCACAAHVAAAEHCSGLGSEMVDVSCASSAASTIALVEDV